MNKETGVGLCVTVTVGVNVGVLTGGEVDVAVGVNVGVATEVEVAVAVGVGATLSCVSEQNTWSPPPLLIITQLPYRSYGPKLRKSLFAE